MITSAICTCAGRVTCSIKEKYEIIVLLLPSKQNAAEEAKNGTYRVDDVIGHIIGAKRQDIRVDSRSLVVVAQANIGELRFTDQTRRNMSHTDGARRQIVTSGVGEPKNSELGRIVHRSGRISMVTL